MNDKSEGMHCFVIIALTTTAIVIVELIARAFFYEQARYIALFLPLLIGSIALCIMGITRKIRNIPQATTDQTNPVGVRRVRVTGPVK